MTDFVSDVFTTFSDAVGLPVETETAAIRDAQRGDDAAVRLLIRAYAPALRSAVTGYLKHLSPGERDLYRDDVRSEAILGFLEVVQTHDFTIHPRLAGRVCQYLSAALSRASRQEIPLSIPDRSLSRYLQIMRAADHEPERARELAPDYGMSRGNFDSLHRATTVLSLTPATGPDDETEPRSVEDISAVGVMARVEDAMMVEKALSALDDDERQIVLYAYGFATGEPLSDAAIVEALSLAALGREAVDGGQTIVSRQTVNRRRGNALAKMRETFGLAA